MNIAYFTKKEKIICLTVMFAAVILMTVCGIEYYDEIGIPAIVLPLVCDGFILIFVPWTVFNKKEPDIK